VTEGLIIRGMAVTGGLVRRGMVVWGGFCDERGWLY
jgi:hypothetical protein